MSKTIMMGLVLVMMLICLNLEDSTRHYQEISLEFLVKVTLLETKIGQDQEELVGERIMKITKALSSMS